jgi:hypothetical protein
LKGRAKTEEVEVNGCDGRKERLWEEEEGSFIEVEEGVVDLKMGALARFRSSRGGWFLPN